MMFRHPSHIERILVEAGVDVQNEHPLVVGAMLINAKKQADKAIRAAKQSARDKLRNEARLRNTKM